MAFISSKEFYKRHINEIKKHVYQDRKTLVISNVNSDFFFEENENLKLMFIDIKKDFEEQKMKTADILKSKKCKNRYFYYPNYFN